MGMTWVGMDMDTWAACTPLARMGITPTRHPWPPACPAAPCRRETRPATAIRAQRSSGPAAAVLRLALCPVFCCCFWLLHCSRGSRGAGQPHHPTRHHPTHPTHALTQILTFHRSAQRRLHHPVLPSCTPCAVRRLTSAHPHCSPVLLPRLFLCCQRAPSDV
jgi:hypothetical protein